MTPPVEAGIAEGLVPRPPVRRCAELLEQPVRRRLKSSPQRLVCAPSGLLNWSYTSKFIGHDVSRLPPGKEHALISTYQTVGYLENDQLVILEPGQRVRVETVDWESLATRPTAADSAAVEEAISLYASLAFKTGLLRGLN